VTRVEELIAFLRMMDPKAPVMLWDDGNLYDLTVMERIHPEQARIERKHKHTVCLG